jgi:membrane protease YdiL (CAAX protease family)
MTRNWVEHRTSLRKVPVIVWLGLATLVLFGGGGIALITGVQQRALEEVLVHGMGAPSQVLYGLLVGAAIGFMAWAIIRAPGFTPLRERYAMLIGLHVQQRSMRIAISICAGVGEELFFRGALQPWLGIPVTAVVFVAIHGYLDPRDKRLFIYGAALTLGMMVLGWMADVQGLVGPMVAHTLIDIILLERLHTTYHQLTAADQSRE